MNGLALWLLIGNIAITAALASWLPREFQRTTQFINRRITMATQEGINAVVAQLNKSLGELQVKLAEATADIRDQLAPGQEIDLSALEAVAQQLDDLVPDAEAVTTAPGGIEVLPPSVEAPAAVETADKKRRRLFGLR